MDVVRHILSRDSSAHSQISKCIATPVEVAVKAGDVTVEGLLYNHEASLMIETNLRPEIAPPPIYSS